MKVKIKLKEGAILPMKGSSDAMCFDCYAHSITVNEHGKTEVDLGFSLEPPLGYGVRLIPRSNLTKHWWAMNNSIGIGDPDYRGSYKVIFTPMVIPTYNKEGEYYTHAIEGFPYKVGERICQLEVYKREDFEFEEVEDLSETERGDGGFGSTGVQ